ncbi:MAG: chemotaxis protein CheW [Methylobacter sp.]
MNALTQAAQTLPATAGSPEQEEQQQYLTFMLSGETYAISILRIKEIIQYGQLTEVPRMPEFIRGVINLRGAVVPVIDLSARFGKPPTAVGRRNCIIIIEVALGAETQSVGVMVDAVNAVLEIPGSEIEPAPSFGTNIRADFIAGMGKINGKFVIILNIQHVLSMDDMEALVSMGSSSAAPVSDVVQVG